MVLAAVFIIWQRTEKTLSIHSIDTARREAFYWAAVVATFAMGTAVGDLTATTFHLGYFYSLVLFAGDHPHPGHRLPVAAVELDLLLLVRVRHHPPDRRVVRRLAGQARQRERPRARGDGNVSLGLTVIIACLVAYLAITHKDVQQPQAA